MLMIGFTIYLGVGIIKSVSRTDDNVHRRVDDTRSGLLVQACTRPLQGYKLSGNALP